jgi:hypothetical protein
MSVSGVATEVDPAVDIFGPNSEVDIFEGAARTQQVAEEALATKPEPKSTLMRHQIKQIRI